MILLIKCICHKKQKCAQNPKSDNFLLKEITPNKTISSAEVKINIATNLQDSNSSKTTELSIPEDQVPTKSGKLLQELSNSNKNMNKTGKTNLKRLCRDEESEL